MSIKDVIMSMVKKLFGRDPIKALSEVNDRADIIDNKPSKTRVIPNYTQEIEDAKKNLLDAYSQKQEADKKMKKINLEHIEECKGMLNKIEPSHRKSLETQTINKIIEMVARNSDLVSQLMNQSVNIDKIFESIQNTEITVKGPLKWDDDKTRGMTDEERDKYRESKDWNKFKSREEYTGKFEDALVYMMSKRIDAKEENGEVIPKNYEPEEIDEIKNFIQLVSKYELKYLRYWVEIQEYEGKAYGSHFALIKSLSPDLIIPEEIQSKYNVPDMENYQKMATSKMNKLIEEGIASTMTELGDENTRKAADFFKGQITNVTGLIAKSKSEEEFIQNFSGEFKIPDFTPLRVFLAHLWQSSRVVSQGNNLNKNFIILREVEGGKEPTLIPAE